MKKKILITSSVATSILIAMASILGIFDTKDAKEIFKIITDASLVDGVVFICVGLLTICSNKGAFRIFGYGWNSFILLFQNDDYKLTHQESYHDYNVRKDANPKQVKHLFIVGLGLIILSLVALAIYSII